MAVWKISDEKVRARDRNARRLKAVGAGKFECQRAPIHALKLTPTDWAVQPLPSTKATEFTVPAISEALFSGRGGQPFVEDWSGSTATCEWPACGTSGPAVE
jgi:hypothetical protein